MIPFSIIVAIDEKRGIGINGKLPWHLPHDLKYFKELTTSVESPMNINAVVMGRNTWESIPPKFRPLPNRLNIVLSRNANYSLPNGVLKFGSLSDLFNFLNQKEDKNIEQIFITGGQQVFEEAIKMPNCQKLYITHVLKTFTCDTFFPEFESKYTRSFFSSCRSENDIPYYFAIYDRIQFSK